MSDHEGEDVKPKVDVIHLVVKSLQGDETQFKVKKTTTFDKILKAYAGKKSLNKGMLSFHMCFSSPPNYNLAGNLAFHVEFTFSYVINSILVCGHPLHAVLVNSSVG